MAPMIDIVFQLLIFFMLQLNIKPSEGNFNINMPTIAPSNTPTDVPKLPEIKITMKSDAQGRLTQLLIGERSLGNGDAAFERLSGEILQIIGRPNNPLTKDTEVEIAADYDLHYSYVVRAISRCMGKMDPKTRKPIQYIEKIKFAPPARPR